MANETRTDQVYQQIRSDILAGSIAPNSRLQFSQLNKSYGLPTDTTGCKCKPADAGKEIEVRYCASSHLIA